MLLCLLIMSSVKETRIEIRISQDQKLLLEKAAQLRGLSLSAFVLSNSLDAAKEVVTDHDRFVLSDQDRDLFLAKLAEPSEPNPELRSAAQSYRSKYGV